MEGVEDVVWRERGQVFSVLTKLGSSCQLVRPPDDIKRRSVMIISKVFYSGKTNAMNWQSICLVVEKQMGSHLQLCHDLSKYPEYSCPTGIMYSKSV